MDDLVAEQASRKRAESMLDEWSEQFVRLRNFASAKVMYSELPASLQQQIRDKMNSRGIQDVECSWHYKALSPLKHG